MITIKHIEQAASILAPIVHRTPVLSSRRLNALVSNSCFFKAENFQRIGAFKIRGAYNKIASLSENERARGVIAHSSGNHAQGVALSASLFGIKAVVVMPHDSVKSKVEAARGYGAEVVFCEPTTDDRERATNALIQEHGYTLIHPYNDETLIAGQGTVALELCADVPDLDFLFVPVGGGGLISGCAIAAKAMCPKISVIGVETEGANDCAQSFRAKKLISLDKVHTIADGMRTRSVGLFNWEIIRMFVDDVVTIRDEDIPPMVRFFVQSMKIVVEPTGAVAPAAIMSNVLKLKGKRVAAVISGGNIDSELLSKMLRE